MLGERAVHPPKLLRTASSSVTYTGEPYLLTISVALTHSDDHLTIPALELSHLNHQ